MKENEQPEERKEQEGEKMRPKIEDLVNDLLGREMFGPPEQPLISRRRLVAEVIATFAISGVAFNGFKWAIKWNEQQTPKDILSPEEREVYDSYLAEIKKPASIVYPIREGGVLIDGAERLRYPHHVSEAANRNVLAKEGVEQVINPISYLKQENDVLHEWLIYFSDTTGSFVCVDASDPHIKTLQKSDIVTLPLTSCQTTEYTTELDPNTAEQIERLKGRLDDGSEQLIGFVVPQVS